MSVSSTQSDLPSTGFAWVTLALSTAALLLLCVWALFNQSTLFPDKYLASVEPSSIAPATGSSNNVEPQDANLLAAPNAEAAQLAKEKLVAEQAVAAELAEAKLAQERQAAEQLAAAKLEEEKLAAAKVEEARLAAEQMAAAKVEEARLATEQMAAAKVEEARLAAEQIAAAKVEEAREAAEQIAAAKVEEAREAAEQIAAAKVEEAREAAEQIAAAKVEEERLAAEQIAAELAQAKVEEERLAAEQLAAEQLADAKLEQERLAALAGPLRAIPEVKKITAESDVASGNETPFEALRREELSALPGLAARVRFIPSEIDIRESSKKPLDRLFELLFLYSETTVTVQVASNEYEIDNNNRLISRERALALVNYLIERGLDEERFRIRALGKERLPFDSHRVTVIVTVSEND